MAEKEYLNKTVNAGSLQDNAFLAFALSEKLDPKTDSKIKVTLSSQSEANASFSIFSYLNMNYPVLAFVSKRYPSL